MCDCAGADAVYLGTAAAAETLLECRGDTGVQTGHANLQSAALVQLEKYTKRMKVQYNKKSRVQEFQVGQVVL